MIGILSDFSALNEMFLGSQNRSGKRHNAAFKGTRTRAQKGAPGLLKPTRTTFGGATGVNKNAVKSPTAVGLQETARSTPTRDARYRTVLS